MLPTTWQLNAGSTRHGAPSTKTGGDQSGTALGARAKKAKLLIRIWPGRQAVEGAMEAMGCS